MRLLIVGGVAGGASAPVLKSIALPSKRIQPCAGIALQQGRVQVDQHVDKDQLSRKPVLPANQPPTGQREQEYQEGNVDPFIEAPGPFRFCHIRRRPDDSKVGIPPAGEAVEVVAQGDETSEEAHAEPGIELPGLLVRAQAVVTRRRPQCGEDDHCEGRASRGGQIRARPFVGQPVEPRRKQNRDCAKGDQQCPKP
jgi:hypothetical protein